MFASMKAAVHLGKDYEENSRVTRKTEFSEIRPMFSITQKLVFDQQDETFGASTIDWDQSTWVHERSVKLSTVYSFFRGLDTIDGAPVVFECKISQDTPR